MANDQSSSGSVVWKIMRNKSGYTEEEIQELQKTKWGKRMSEISSYPYWIKVEMVKTNRCTAGWHQGDTLYFNNSGMLISRKAPRVVCAHALAALSPAFYACTDRLSRGANPEDIVIDHVSCTDPGFDHKGLGNNTMRITFEKIPVFQRILDTLSIIPYLFYRSTNARGPEPGGLPKNKSFTDQKDKPVNPLSANRSKKQLSNNVAELLKKCPLTESESDLFVQSDRRIRRLSGIERFKNAKIVVKVVKSAACIAGHEAGEKIYFDSMGRLLTNDLNKPVCSRLLNKIWYRLLILLDRIADDTTDAIGDGTFSGEIPEVSMSCYGAEFPYGDCGQILMTVSMEGV